MERLTFEFSEKDLDFGFSKEDLSYYKISREYLPKLTLGLGITDKCNLKCPICYYHEKSQMNSFSSLTAEHVKKILEDLKGIGSIVIGLEGEPLCHDHVTDIISTCSQYSEDISIVTNGLLLKESLIDYFNDSKVNSIIFSCDATDEKTYSLTRVGGSFNRFCSKVKLASKYFNGKLSIHTVVTDLNIDNLTSMPSFIKNLGIHELSYGQLRPTPMSKLNSINRPSESKLREFIKLTVKNALENKITINFDAFFSNELLTSWINTSYVNNPFVKINYMKSCFYPWRFASILSNGALFPCCGDITPIALNEYTFDNIFNNQVLLNLRKKIQEDKALPSVCSSCLV